MKHYRLKVFVCMLNLALIGLGLFTFIGFGFLARKPDTVTNENILYNENVITEEFFDCTSDTLAVYVKEHFGTYTGWLARVLTTKILKFWMDVSPNNFISTYGIYCSFYCQVGSVLYYLMTLFGYWGVGFWFGIFMTVRKVKKADEEGGYYTGKYYVTNSGVTADYVSGPVVSTFVFGALISIFAAPIIGTVLTFKYLKKIKKIHKSQKLRKNQKQQPQANPQTNPQQKQ